MKVCVLASGSAGNSIFVQQGITKVLVDAGLAGKRIEERLQAVGVDGSELQALVVTHEHSDPMHGVGVLARRYGLPVWMTRGTYEGSKRIFRGRERIRIIVNDEDFDIGDLHFQPFSISHDAIDPVNYVVKSEQSTLGIATDMGTVTQLVYQRIRDADLVVMETNYDRDLLMNGPYPWDLKKRISSNRGHLANDRAADTLCRLAGDGLQQAVLAHLSEKNNRPDLAEQVCREDLRARGVNQFMLSVARQERPSQIFII